MAVMLPDEVESFTTDGEKQFYRFLAQIAKPDHSHVAWYLPNIDGKEPDFILFAREVGLIIFEVKDWTLEQIRTADPFQFTLCINSRDDSRKNPLRQARDYQVELMDKLKSGLGSNFAHYPLSG